MIENIFFLSNGILWPFRSSLTVNYNNNCLNNSMSDYYADCYKNQIKKGGYHSIVFERRA